MRWLAVLLLLSLPGPALAGNRCTFGTQCAEETACTATVFGNEIETADGKVVQKHIVLQRAYKDKDGNFQNSSSFGVNDVPKAVLALQEAYRYVMFEGRVPAPSELRER